VPTPQKIVYSASATGALFVPALQRPMPTLLLLDPGGSARRIVQRYMPAAASHGWILAASDMVRNGTQDEADERELVDLLAHVRGHAAVDDRRVYTGGFSGGACGAYRLALVRPDLFAGAIVECGHMGPWRELAGRAVANQAFYLFTRGADFNRLPTQQLRGAMEAAGCRVTLVERSGGHSPMTPAELPAALDWLAAS
jgi:predicted esterase